jgi:hypothetical protein
MRPSGTINPFPPVRRRQTPHLRRLRLMRHHRAPWRRRKPHHRRRHRPIVADAIKDRIEQPRHQRLHPCRPRGVSANNSARRNLRLLPQLPRRRHRRLRANNGSNGLSVHRNRRKLRRLLLLLRRQLRHQGRLRANNVNSAPHTLHKLRRLHKLHRRHRLRANNGSNVPSVHRNPRHLLLLLRLQSRLLLRQRLQQNRPIPITAKNRTATGKTIGPVRPDPVHRIGCAIFKRENSDLRLSLGSSRCAVPSAMPGSV